MFDVIVALILFIAADVGIPPYFALAIALEENSALNPYETNRENTNRTVDLGIMQLNSEYYGHIDWSDPETNIRAGCLHIKDLMNQPGINTYWSVAAAYNCGYYRFISSAGPPEVSVNHANRVMERWLVLEGVRHINPVIRGNR